MAAKKLSKGSPSKVKPKASKRGRRGFSTPPASADKAKPTTKPTVKPGKSGTKNSPIRKAAMKPKKDKPGNTQSTRKVRPDNPQKPPEVDSLEAVDDDDKTSLDDVEEGDSAVNHESVTPPQPDDDDWPEGDDELDDMGND